MANDQSLMSGLLAEKEVVQISARMQPLKQSDLTGFCSGQQGMCSAICIPDIGPAISAVIAGLGDAMALAASPMLAGPMTTASMATTRNRRCMALANFMPGDLARRSQNWKRPHADVLCLLQPQEVRIWSGALQSPDWRMMWLPPSGSSDFNRYRRRRTLNSFWVASRQSRRVMGNQRVCILQPPACGFRNCHFVANRP